MLLRPRHTRRPSRECDRNSWAMFKQNPPVLYIYSSYMFLYCKCSYSTVASGEEDLPSLNYWLIGKSSINKSYEAWLEVTKKNMSPRTSNFFQVVATHIFFSFTSIPDPIRRAYFSNGLVQPPTKFHFVAVWLVSKLGKIIDLTVSLLNMAVLPWKILWFIPCIPGTTSLKWMFGHFQPFPV